MSHKRQPWADSIMRETVKTETILFTHRCFGASVVSEKQDPTNGGSTNNIENPSSEDSQRQTLQITCPEQQATQCFFL